MATQVQFRRGTSTENNSFTGALGEVTVDTTNDTLRVHDGSTAGGFQSAKLTGTQDITLNNQADLRFGDSDGSHYVALQAPGTVSSNVTFTLPAADGSSGQAMVTDASGNLSFAAAGATISADTSTNTDFLLYFAATTSGALTAVKQDSGLLYNPSTGTLTSAAFTGVASSAKYADLAERYTADSNYQSGTVLVFGGNEEVTESTQRLDKRIAGIVSTDPAYLMNSELENSVAVGLQGRVPCKVIGEIRKGDLMVSSATPGHAEAWLEDSNPPTGCVIGKALENKIGAGPDVIEVVVGRI